MPTDIIAVPRALTDVEDLWTTPAACAPVRLRSAIDASAPVLSTSVAAWFDEIYLTILFSAADDHIVANHLAHDAPLYQEDVFEAFLAPAGLTRYFELEVNPRGTLFDAQIHSPQGERATMQVDRDWNCEGLLAAVRSLTESDGVISVDVLLRVPFLGIGRNAPSDGESWRANFFRIDRHPVRGDEYSAWQPTLRDPPDFHVASSFGVLRFEG